MSHKSSRSVYSDGHLSSTSSTWTSTTKTLPRKLPKSIRFLCWVAGAPAGATAVKKRTRDYADDRSSRSGGSSRSYIPQSSDQYYWVGGSRQYDGGSSSGSSSGRSGRRKGGNGPRNHFEGAVQMPPRGPMGPMNMNGPGHFSPRPQGPPPGSFPPPPHMAGMHPMGPPPMAPPPMQAPPGANPPFFDLTGQNRGPPAGGHGYSPASSEDYTSDEESGSEYD